MSKAERHRLREAFVLPPQRRRLSGRSVGVVIAAAACAGLAVGLSGLGTPPVASAATAPATSGGGSVSAAAIPFFGYCEYGGGTNCVVDGDTFYYGRDKVRIAGIDAPETHPPRCDNEARLGEAATHRLRDLLNAGEVRLTRIDRDEDGHGRKLRNVSVGGADVSAALVGEGLARDHAGGRKPWC